MKTYSRRRLWKRGLIAAAVVAILLGCASFATAYAGDTVSPSDAVSSADVGVAEKQIAEKNMVVRKKAPDFLLSNAVRKRGNSSRFKKFLPSASYNGSYKSELDSNEKKLYQVLYDAFVTERKPHGERIAVDFDPPIDFTVVYSDAENDTADDRDLEDVYDQVLSAAAAFFYDCPEAFWIRSFSYEVNFTLTPGSDVGHVDSIVFIFTSEAYPDAYNDLAAFDAGLAAAASSIRSSRSNTSVYATVRAIHDYILLNASYNYNALYGSTYDFGYAYSAVPLFVSRYNGKFVCEGYSKAMKLLCNEFGINCALVSGDGMTSASSGGPHMWNYVQMPDGNWYAVDATWDDGYVYQDGTPSLQHTYFLVGSTSVVRNNRMFSQDHINDGQVMSSPTKFSMVFPPLSESSFDYYITDTVPRINLKTLGASIRLTEPYGIRFGIQIKRDEGLSSVHVIPEFGTLIIASGTLGDKELKINTPMVRKIRADNIYSQDETQYTYTGVLINIPESFFGTNVKGRGYLIYIDNDTGEEHIIYSETVERSFFGVAESAFEAYSSIPDPDEKQREIIGKLREILDKKGSD